DEGDCEYKEVDRVEPEVEVEAPGVEVHLDRQRTADEEHEDGHRGRQPAEREPFELLAVRPVQVHPRAREQWRCQSESCSDATLAPGAARRTATGLTLAPPNERQGDRRGDAGAREGA